MLRPKVLLGLLGILFILTLWQSLIAVGALASEFVPEPLGVIVAATGLMTEAAFLRGLRATIGAWAISLGTVVLTAVPIGIFLGTVPFLRRASVALIELLRPIPSVGLLPLAILLFGLSTTMKVALAVYAAFWPLVINTVYGVSDVDRVLIDTARTMGWGRVTILWRVVLPSSLPYVATGLRVASSVALVLVITAELLAATEGIGQQIAVYQTAGSAVDVFAGVLIVGLLGSLAYVLLLSLEKRLVPWGSQAGGNR
jgi:ABC-type nitrate/sulfonate/bicarbonate transport system permease component